MISFHSGWSSYGESILRDIHQIRIHHQYAQPDSATLSKTTKVSLSNYK